MDPRNPSPGPCPSTTSSSDIRGGDTPTPPPFNPSPSPKKKRNKSPVASWYKSLQRQKTAQESSSPGRDNLVSDTGSISHPASPAPSRLSRVTRALSSSDHNIFLLLKRKARFTQNNSQNAQKDRNNSPTPAFYDPTTPHDDENEDVSFTRRRIMSPSRKFRHIPGVEKASLYVASLKSRIDKHRERNRIEEFEKKTREFRGENEKPSSYHSSPSSRLCCGHQRDQDSFDNNDFDEASTLSNSMALSRVASASDSTRRRSKSEAGTHHGSSSLQGGCGGVGGGSRSSPTHENVNFNAQTAKTSEEEEDIREDVTGNNSTGGGLGMGTRSSSFPFHTLSVHLHRGRNLVARDACGSSDPYVKVKIGDKNLYKSKTINRDLNPTWDESFVLPILDLNQQIIFKVYDYDWGMQDDFMGMTSIDPSRLPLNQSTELSLILTETNTPGTGYMGELVLSVTLVPRTLEEKDIWLSGDFQTGKMVEAQKRLKSQVWSSVLTVLVIEAKNLSPTQDSTYYMDCYIKFRLGNQKFKTRTIQRTTHPKWVEQFDFYLYEGQPQIMEIQVYDETFSKDYIARVAMDVGLFEKERTHKKVLKLMEGTGELSLLLTISGTSGIESMSDLSTYNPGQEEREEIRGRYGLGKSFKSINDVGFLIVKVFEAQGLAALDIGGKSDPFCVLELVNSRVQTQTEYRTLNPIWNKIFTFEVKDVTSILEITVYDEDKNHKIEFLGKLNIPLWTIKNGGEKRWYMLKDAKLLRSAPGNNAKILMEIYMYWNPIRAAIRVLDPPEQKYLVPDQRLRRDTFLLNIDRLKRIGLAIYDVIQYIESCIEWQYPVRSILALVTYQVVCYTFQPYMVPLCLLFFMLKQWLLSSLTGNPLLHEEVSAVDENIFTSDDDDEEKEEDEKKMTLRQKLQAVQDATQTVQNVLGLIASLFESGRNTFRMTVPFVSWLIVFFLCLGTLILYYIPVRYLAMAYGFHKFFRPILRPGAIPTNEVYNILLRIPDNLRLIYYRPLKPTSTSSPKSSTKTDRRSPPSSLSGTQGPGTSSSFHHQDGGGGGSSNSGGKTGKDGKKKYKFW